MTDYTCTIDLTPDRQIADKLMEYGRTFMPDNRVIGVGSYHRRNSHRSVLKCISLISPLKARLMVNSGEHDICSEV